MSGPHFMPLNPDESYTIRIQDGGPNSMRLMLRQHFREHHNFYAKKTIKCDCPICEIIREAYPSFTNPFDGLEVE